MRHLAGVGLATRVGSHRILPANREQLDVDAAMRLWEESSSVSSLTIEQIAALAKVSRSTVSRVLNDHPSVAEVRRRIDAVIAEQGYVPRAAARNLARRHTKVIGIISCETSSFLFSTQFFSRQIDGITKVCVERGYYPLLSMITADMNPRVVEDVMRSRHFDGIVLYGNESTTDLLQLLLRERIPVVQFGRLPCSRG